MPPTPPTRLMLGEPHDQSGAGRGVGRAGIWGATVTESWARLRVSRAWAGIMTTLGRPSWLDRRTSPTVVTLDRHSRPTCWEDFVSSVENGIHFRVEPCERGGRDPARQEALLETYLLVRRMTDSGDLARLGGSWLTPCRAGSSESVALLAPARLTLSRARFFGSVGSPESTALLAPARLTLSWAGSSGSVALQDPARAGFWRATDLGGLARLGEGRDRAWIMETLGRLSRLARWISLTAGSDRLGRLTRMTTSPEISPLQLEPLHPSTGRTCCCHLSLPFSRLFPCENRARLVEHCALSRATTKPLVSLWIIALGTGPST